MPILTKTEYKKYTAESDTITISDSDPLSTDNLPMGTVWLNETTGESFKCADNTEGTTTWTKDNDFKVDLYIPIVVEFIETNYSDKLTSDELGTNIPLSLKPAAAKMVKWDIKNSPHIPEHGGDVKSYSLNKESTTLKDRADQYPTELLSKFDNHNDRFARIT